MLMVEEESDYGGGDGPLQYDLLSNYIISPELQQNQTKATLTYPAPNSSPVGGIRSAIAIDIGHGPHGHGGIVPNPEKHFYPNVLNTNSHPIAQLFFSLGNDKIIDRYLEINPRANRDILRQCLNYTPKYFLWAGSDLFHVTTADGEKKMIIVETNSCPSGQKSMPAKSADRYSGYRTVLEKSFQHMASSSDPTLGDLAVIYDKNGMEASGYATTLSAVAQERVWVAEFYQNDPNPPVKWIKDVMYVRDAAGTWHSIRACFRYVTQKPWNRIPLNSRTLVMNNIIACLCGGRNKAMAAHAYNLMNAELAESGSGLSIFIPETRLDVSKDQIPAIIASMGGKGVIKVPYSNSGQGVYTIMNDADLTEFMKAEQEYQKYLVQSIVEPAAWYGLSSKKKKGQGQGQPQGRQGVKGQYYHVGTVKNASHKSYVNDIRMMVCGGGEGGFEPVSIYSRRARRHIESLEFGGSGGNAAPATSWDMLGTNLSVKTEDDCWDTEANRLILFDRKDFYKLNMGLNDLINAYIQTVLCVIAIDKLCGKCVGPNGEFNSELFQQLNPDQTLLDEIHIS